MRLNSQKISTLLSLQIDSTFEVSSYAIDSRKTQKEGLFFALPGKKVHGESYVQEAANNGAIAAFVSKSYQGKDFGLTLIRVDDVLKCLQQLAKKIVGECNFTIIGVTGSVGKTSTKETIYHILSTARNVSATKKNYNTKRMLPIGILEANRDDEFLLLEMGMTKSGHIDKLCSIATPDIVVLTKIGYCHSENFESIEEIACAKAEILTPKTKFAVMHNESILYKAVYKKCIFDHVLYPQKIPVCSPYSYEPFSENFCAAYLLCKHLGMSDNQIRLASLKLLSKTNDSRFNMHVIDNVHYIDDSYNANAMSVSAALKHLENTFCRGRKIFVCGSMTELGKESKRLHMQVAKKALLSVDLLFCIGKETKDIADEFVANNKQAFHYGNFEELSNALFSKLLPNDLVLIKGSKPFALWRLIEKATMTANKR